MTLAGLRYIGMPARQGGERRATISLLTMLYRIWSRTREPLRPSVRREGGCLGRCCERLARRCRLLCDGWWPMSGTQHTENQEAMHGVI